MSMVDLIPGVATVKLYARAVEFGVFALAIAGIGGSMWWMHHHNVQIKAQLVAEKRSHADDLAAEAAAAAAAKIASLAEGARRMAEQSEINNETERLVNRARADAVAADRADVGVRSAFRAAAGCRAAPADPGPSGVSAPASAAVDVRADVFGELDGRAGVLAAALDKAYVAGRACERSRDSLRPATISLEHLKLGS